MRRLREALAAAGVGLCLAGSLAPAATEPPAREKLRVYFSPEIFSTVNRNDALASGKVWIETVGRGRGLDLDVEVDTYGSVEHLRQIIQRRTGDLFIMGSMHYLDLGADRDRVEVVFAPLKGAAVQEKYLLLTRRDRHLTLPQLRGRQLLVLTGTGANLCRTWVAALTQDEGLGTVETFFQSVTEVSKPSSAVLPVYFEKADACVVNSKAFEVMRELNPQLGEVLEPCLTSPPYLETVVAVHRQFAGLRQDLIEGLAGLHDEVAGRQILTVFKIDRLVPFADQDLETIRSLRAGHAGGKDLTSR